VIKLPFNPGNRASQIGVSIVVLLLIAALATKCQAADRKGAYAQFGVGYTLRGDSSVLDLAVIKPDVVRDADIEMGLTFYSASELYDLPQGPNFAWRVQLVDGFGNFDVGLGIAVLPKSDIYNTGTLNFSLSLGYRFQRIPVTVSLRHLSNGGTSSPNKGRDALTISYRF